MGAILDWAGAVSSGGGGEILDSGWRWGNIPIPVAHVVLIVVGVILNLLWPLSTGWEGSWVIAAGVFLIGVAVVVIIWATRAAARVNLAAPDHLVTGGPYGMSRHPMYVAWTLLYLGVTLIVASWWLLVLLPVLAVWIHLESVREEQRMVEAFGVSYEQYQARVRRYI